MCTPLLKSYYEKTLKIHSLNVNCLSKNNGYLHEQLINYENPDKVCLTETHLKDDEIISINGYRYVGTNRPMSTGNRGSGGIGILYKNELLNSYSAELVYHHKDNVIDLQFSCKLTQSPSVLIYCVYLPPENSHYGLENEEVLNLLTMEMYKQVETDHIYICGDFNAQIGNKPDSLNMDGLPPRTALDITVNTQGHKLLTFINDIKGCVVNGRVSPECDGYTSVTSYRGRAVVDYHITRQSDLKTVTKMKIKSCIDIITSEGWEELISDVCRPPYHSLLCMELELSEAIHERLYEDKNLGSKSIRQQKLYQKIRDSYMNNETAMQMLQSLLIEIDDSVVCQNEMNDNYNKLVNLLLTEAKELTKKIGKRRPGTKFKSYWDSELARKWKIMKNMEKEYRKCKSQHKQMTGLK